MKKAIYLTLACMIACCITANAQTWHVDPTYGLSSPGLTTFPYYPSGGVQSFRTSNGNIATVYNTGNGAYSMLIVMTTPDGALVTSYGNNGIVEIIGLSACFGPANYHVRAYDAAMDANDNIYICGGQIEENYGSSTRAFVARLDAGGNLVYGDVECLPYTPNSASNYGALVVQPNGNVLCYGAEGHTINGGGDGFFAKLYSPTGAVIYQTGLFYQGWGGAGTSRGVLMEDGVTNVFAYGINTGPGYANTDFFHLISFDASSPTLTFSDVATGYGNMGTGCNHNGGSFGMKRIPGNKIRLAVSPNDVFPCDGQLLQFTSSLVADNTFGVNGVLTFSSGLGGIGINEMQMDADGNMYLFGGTYNTDVIKLLPSGALDSNFPYPGGSGEIILPYPFSSDDASTGLVYDAHHIYLASRYDPAPTAYKPFEQTMLTDLPFVTSTPDCPNVLLSCSVTPQATTNIGYQWYYYNNPISGATSSTYTATATGNYYLAIINTATGLSIPSNTISVTVGQTYYRDADGDGYGDPATTQCGFTQPPGYVDNNRDCNDANANVHPGATEVCNGIDDNCDGRIDESLMSGLMLYLPFDGNANDATGRGNNGTLVNGPSLTTGTTGTPGSAYQLNGTNQRIDVANSADIDPQSLTLSLWVYYDNIDGVRQIIGKGYCSGWSDSYGFWFQNGQLRTLLGDGSYSYSGLIFAAPAANQWHHLALTFDNAADVANVYIDNVLSGTFTFTSDIYYENYPLTIGADFDQCNFGYNYGGKVDEVALFNRALSSAEINQLYTSGPYGHLYSTYYADADGDGYGDPNVSINSCTPVPGYVLNNTDCDDTHASVHPGAPEICDGLDNDCDGYIDLLQGKAVAFDGSNDYISLPSLLNGQVQFTIAYWIKTTENRSNGTFWNRPTMIGVANPGAPDGDFGIISQSGKIGMWSGLCTCGDREIVSSRSINDNSWHYIAMTGDGATLTLYVDGLPVGTLPGNQGINSSEGIDIGGVRTWYGNDFFHQGTYDNVNLWSYARTQAQIQSDVNGFTAPQAGLVAYYKFENNLAIAGGNNIGQTSLADNSGNGNTGTLINFALSGATSNWVNGITDASIMVTYYADADGDGYGDPAVTQTAPCGQPPAGYVANNTDCNDHDAAVHVPIQYYIDADHDGYGSTTTAMLCSSTAPVGYSTNNTDCDDNDAAIHTPLMYYVDADGDGYDNGTAMLCSSTAPAGYSATTLGSDCNDSDARAHAVPVFTSCPSDITVNCAPGMCSASVSFSATVQNTMSVTSSYPSGYAFPVGTTHVTMSGGNSCGSAECSFNVTVVDNEAPIISGCPSNITVNSNTSSCNKAVTWNAPTASDNCGMQYLTSNYNSGDAFPVGTTTVTYTAIDVHGNTSACSFTVTVVDNVPPVIFGCPANITVNSNANSCGKAVNWDPVNATDNCGMQSFVSNYVSGATFPAGITTVTYTATDIHGNVSMCSFTITVVDNVPPVIIGCNNNITVNSNASNCTASAFWSQPTASDNCGLQSFTSNYVSGSTFSSGVTTVTYTATDVHGNTATCSFTVTVNCSSGCNMTVNAGTDEDTYYGYTADQTVTHTAVAAGGTPPYTYSWMMNRAMKCNQVNAAGDEQFYTGAPSGCIRDTCPSTGSPTLPPLCISSAAGASSVTVMLTDTALVICTVRDASGCTAVDTFKVRATDARCFAGNSNNGKVNVCHHAGNNWVQICVEQIAVAALVAQGDLVGTCHAYGHRPEGMMDEPASYLTAYPNPFSNKTTVAFSVPTDGNTVVRVFDALGRRVVDLFDGMAKSGTEYKVEFDGSKYAEGMYFYRIISGEMNKTLKMQLIK